NTSRTLTASGDSANMTMVLTRTNDGTFVGRLCAYRGHTFGGGDSVLYRKGFRTTCTRSAVLQSVPDVEPDSGEEGTHWVLKQVSLAYSRQDSPLVASPRISKITISGTDTSGAPASVAFTDPSALFDPHGLPVFASGTQVT